MINKKKVLSNLEIKNISKKTVEKAKEKRMIKSLSEAFTTNPTKEETHKGKIDYFCN